MMKKLSFKKCLKKTGIRERNIIKDARSLFGFKKEVDDTTIKDIKNLSDWKKK